MSNIIHIAPDDTAGISAVRALLEHEGLRLDAHVDYTCAICDADGTFIATGSCAGNTLRCFAVVTEHRGEGMLRRLLDHLMGVQAARGNGNVFLYTKPTTAPYFKQLGFYEVARVPNRVVFMENRPDGFSGMLAKWKAETPAGTYENIGAVVLNANPFTLGHQYLIEYAAARSGLLHVFIVSEDVSFFPSAVRERLVRAGTAHLPNVVCHASGPYIVSQATFPSYFQKDEDEAIRGHAALDLVVFTEIAAALGITRRFVGAEQASHVTSLYNDSMHRLLPQAGITCEIIPRKEHAGAPISASSVRTCIREGRMKELADLVPAPTLAYLTSEESADVRRAIRRAENVIHY